MPAKKKIGAKIRVKLQPLDTTGLGYQRAKQIADNKAEQANKERLNRAIDVILRKENIKSPTIQEKEEARQKLMDDMASKIATQQKNDLLNVATTLLGAKKPRVASKQWGAPKVSTIRQKAKLNSKTPFESETLPPALLPPTTYPDYMGDIRNTIKQGSQMLQEYNAKLDAEAYAPKAKTKQTKIKVFMSPSTPASMPQVIR